jgi:hypothetical protein
MTVIHFETESDNTTLAENIRAVANTLSRALTPQTRVVQRPAQITAGNGVDSGAEVLLEPDVDGFDDIIDVEPAQVGSKAKTAKTPVLRQPQPLDLDLISGEVPFKDFMEQKNPTTDIKRYLVIAFWLKHYRNINDVTMDHAYTCYRFMGAGWNVPKDASAPFRQMKTKRYGWANSGANPGSFAINHLGENEVNNMGGS